MIAQALRATQKCCELWKMYFSWSSLHRCLFFKKKRKIFYLFSNIFLQEFFVYMITIVDRESFHRVTLPRILEKLVIHGSEFWGVFERILLEYCCFHNIIFKISHIIHQSPEDMQIFADWIWNKHYYQGNRSIEIGIQFGHHSPSMDKQAPPINWYSRDNW